MGKALAYSPLEIGFKTMWFWRPDSLIRVDGIEVYSCKKRYYTRFKKFPDSCGRINALISNLLNWKTTRRF